MNAFCGGLRCCAAIGLLLTTIAAAPVNRALQVRLYAMSQSGESGTATLTPRGTGLVVSIEISGSNGRVQYAHFHRGTCEHVASPAVYVLQPVRNGRSTTRLVDVGLEQLLHGTYSVLIHASSSPNSPHVACGTISGV